MYFNNNQIQLRNGGGKVTPLYSSGTEMEWIAMGN